MKIRHGDLIDLALAGEFDVIVHGCNCFNTMGRGIAKSIRDRLPEAFEADQMTARGDLTKLGSYSSALIIRGEVNFTVVNAYTQGHYRGRGVKADYDAIATVFRQIAADFPQARIGYPKLGAGLAGGDWGRISHIIDTELAGFDHTLVVLS